MWYRNNKQRWPARSRRLAITIAAALCSLIIVAVPAGALDYNVYCVRIGCALYDPNADACPTGRTPTPSRLLEKEGEVGKRVYEYFTAKITGLPNLTPAQAAGIIGNWKQESWLDPTSEDGPAIGIAQWESGRDDNLKAFAQRQEYREPPYNNNWRNLDIQMDFTWHELQTSEKAALEDLKKTLTPEQAAISFQNKFERPDPQFAMQANRVKYANEAYVLYAKLPIPQAPSQSSATADPAQETCPAVSGSNINVDGYSFPLPDSTKKKLYENLFPCSSPQLYGAYTINGVYTDKYRKSTRIRTCHHDATPAFDLMTGNGGTPVYAITKGKIVNYSDSYTLTEGPGVEGCVEIQFQANNGTDNTFYWYGHLQDIQVKANQTVEAGQLLAVTATLDKTWRCYGGGPHLHIDRGCVTAPNGKPQHGGSKNCRDPQFLNDLAKIWTGSSAPTQNITQPQGVTEL